MSSNASKKIKEKEEEYIEPVRNRKSPLTYRFAVVFLIGGFIPNALDIRFQSVSGISSSIETDTIIEGGENIFVNKVPKRMNYENLTLKRGVVIGSPLNIEFNIAMSFMTFFPSNVIVTSIDDENMPILGSGWLFWRAYPVKWSVSELSGSDNNLVIDTMELTYARLQHLRI